MIPVPGMDETNCQRLDICTFGIYFVYEDICLGRGEKELIVYHGFFSPDTVSTEARGGNKSVQIVAIGKNQSITYGWWVRKRSDYGVRSKTVQLRSVL